MNVRNVLAATLILVSFALLIPGLTLPMLTISASITFLGQDHEVLNETRSVLQSIETLHDTGNDFVAGLILLFSVIVPFVKGALLGLALIPRVGRWRYRIFVFVRSISKWAMNDVFVVGVYVAYLAARATENLDAVIHSGFYWFTAYCLVSLLALQLMKVEPPSGGR